MGFSRERFEHQLMLEALDPTPGVWWLSFVDTTMNVPPEEQVPGGPSFLGVCMVVADGPMQAVNVSHMLRINPGGEVQIHGPFPVGMVHESWLDRLLSKDQIEAGDVDDFRTERPF